MEDQLLPLRQPIDGRLVTTTREVMNRPLEPQSNRVIGFILEYRVPLAFSWPSLDYADEFDGEGPVDFSVKAMGWRQPIPAIPTKIVVAVPPTRGRMVETARKKIKTRSAC
jgi:hypothetical protein